MKYRAPGRLLLCSRSLPPRGAWIEIAAIASPLCPCPCRSPHGERGLKSHLPSGIVQIHQGRSPHGERGLKYLLLADRRGHYVSLPPRGAWIEIGTPWRKARKSWSRSPHGERGLKCQTAWSMVPIRWSLPPRGAWIEIYGHSGYFQAESSLPPRGAWIEI